MQQAPPVHAIVNESEECIPIGVPLPELWCGGLAPLSKLTASSRLGADQEGAAASESGANIHLCFLSRLTTPIYTAKNITAEGNKAIRIGIFEGDNMITEGPLSKVKVEMLALRGHFSDDDREIWTEEEFENHIVQDRHRQGSVLGGNCSVWLNNGEASFGSIRFIENSSRTRSRKFVVAARVCMSENINVRVQEAIMKAVTVLDRRNPDEKWHTPKLTDEVYCLKGISRDGTYHYRLRKANICTVQDFLMALNKDENKLCNEVLRLKKQHSFFREMVKHARECTLGDDQIDRAKKEGEWDKLMNFGAQ